MTAVCGLRGIRTLLIVAFSVPVFGFLSPLAELPKLVCTGSSGMSIVASLFG